MEKLSTITVLLLVAVMLIKETQPGCTHSKHGVQLTSSLESNGRRAACPGETVVYTCRVPDTGVLQWAIESFSTYASNSIILTVQWDVVGTVETQQGGLITANVTSIIPRNVYWGEITSTLTILYHKQFNNKTIWCGNGGISESDSPCVLNYYGSPPSAPVSLSYEVILYSGSVFSVLLEWTSPENDGGLVVSNYTIILQSNYSLQRFVTVHNKQYITLLYNQMHSVQVTATNCRGEGPPTNISDIRVVECGLPDGLSVNASNHKLSTHEGSKYTFLCSDNGIINLECSQNGTWIQMPSNIIECSQLDSLFCKTPVPPESSHIYDEKSVKGSVVVYQCENEYDITTLMVSICLSREWTPDTITVIICTRRVDCGAPVAPELGLVYYNDTRLGSKAVIECSEGLSLDGEHVNHAALCSLNGSWVPDPSKGRKCISTDGKLLIPEKHDKENVFYAVIGTAMLLVSLLLGILIAVVCLICYFWRKKSSSTSSPHPTYEDQQPPPTHVCTTHNEAYSISGPVI